MPIAGLCSHVVAGATGSAAEALDEHEDDLGIRDGANDPSSVETQNQLLERNQSMLDCELDEACEVVDSEFLHHSSSVRLDRFGGKGKGVSDIVCRASLGEKLKNLALTRTQSTERIDIGRVAQDLVQDEMNEYRAQVANAHMDASNSRNHLLRGGPFDDISECAGLERTQYVDLIGVHRQDDGPGAWAACPDDVRGLRAVKMRHPVIDDGYIGP